MDKAKLEKVILLDREMMKVEIDLEVDAVESQVKERRRQEDQAKTLTTKTLTSEESRQMKRLDYDTIGGKEKRQEGGRRNFWIRETSRHLPRRCNEGEVDYWERTGHEAASG